MKTLTPTGVIYTVSIKIMIREHHPADDIAIQKEMTGAFENGGRDLIECTVERLEELRAWVEDNVGKKEEGEPGEPGKVLVWPGGDKPGN